MIFYVGNIAAFHGVFDTSEVVITFKLMDSETL